MQPMEIVVMIVLPVGIVLAILAASIRTLFKSPLAKDETVWCQASKNYPKWKVEGGKLTIRYKKQERIYSLDRVKELQWNEEVVKNRAKMGVANVFLKDGMHFMLTYHFDHKERGRAALEDLKKALAEIAAEGAAETAAEDASAK